MSEQTLPTEALDSIIERIESLRDERNFPAHLLAATDDLLEIAQAMRAADTRSIPD